jgi:hypothetical protein
VLALTTGGLARLPIYALMTEHGGSIGERFTHLRESSVSSDRLIPSDSQTGSALRTNSIA